jgi:23S rRNA pseudouridine1911/1915/1917 synthase
MTEITPITLIIPQNLGGLRLDQALQKLMPEHSRSRLQSWIKDGLITLTTAASSNEAISSKTKVWGGEKIQITPQIMPEQSAFKAQDIPINIIYW